MSLGNLPTNPSYGGNRLQLFNIDHPLTFSAQEFETRWKEVDNVWVPLGTTRVLKKAKGWTKNYDCRFKKRHASSKKDKNTPVDKQRKTSTRDSDLCQAQITVTLKDGIVTVRKTHPDGPDHTHELTANDLLKKPAEITEFVMAEATKGYRAPAIKEAAQDHFKDRQLGEAFLQLESVLNIQHKVRGGLNVPFVGAGNLAEDLGESFEWLKSKGYQTEYFENTQYQGFAFATDKNLNALRTSGHFVIMDSTHKTNKHGWKLYTVLIRDAFASWLPGGHFFVSGEEQWIVAKGLQVLKRWARAWIPRYFIIDLSAIEENAVVQVHPNRLQ